jgi:hypothetical protein
VLINASPFHLIGLVHLNVAASLDPEDSVLEQRRRLAAWLAAQHRHHHPGARTTPDRIGGTSPG